jgi:ribosome-associated protein
MPRAEAATETDQQQALLDIVRRSLDDGKAEDVVVIDLQGKSSIADAMVIATGRSQRQVVALAERLRADIETGTRHRVSVEGLPQGDWVLLDAGDVIVHLFRPEVRAYYNLEKMWGVALPEGVPATAAAASGFGASVAAPV